MKVMKGSVKYKSHYWGNVENTFTTRTLYFYIYKSMKQ
jgi:hypothetical protein